MGILALTDAQGRTITIIAPPGETLAQAIWLSGFLAPKSMCAGLGLCGKCKLRFISAMPEPTAKDASFFTAAELAQGWRLGCQHLIPKNETLVAETLHVQIPDKFIDLAHKPEPERSDSHPVFLGIDLGTTSIAWRAVDEHGKAASGERQNPQAAAGADIISRLRYASEAGHKERLATLAENAIIDIIQNLEKNSLHVKRACIAANSAMTEILLKKDIIGLCRAPAALSYHGAEIIPYPPGPNQTETVFPPLVAPFVGSDISCGLLYLLHMDAPSPFLLADLGTNAELALFVDADNLHFASLPLGPALEGIGPACGHAAAPGVISSFRLTPQGIEPVFLPGNKTDNICATGYLSLINILREVGIIGRDGHFITDTKNLSPLGRRMAEGLDRSRSQTIFHLPGKLYLAENDIEQLLKVRAALTVGIAFLLNAAGLKINQIAKWFVAGATGEHAARRDLETLGLPEHLSEKLVAAGNSSLEGACLLACEPERLEVLNSLCKRAAVLQFTDDPAFAKAYIDAMQWN